MCVYIVALLEVSSIYLFSLLVFFLLLRPVLSMGETERERRAGGRTLKTTILCLLSKSCSFLILPSPFFSPRRITLLLRFTSACNNGSLSFRKKKNEFLLRSFSLVLLLSFFPSFFYRRRLSAFLIVVTESGEVELMGMSRNCRLDWRPKGRQSDIPPSSPTPDRQPRFSARERERERELKRETGS